MNPYLSWASKLSVAAALMCLAACGGDDKGGGRSRAGSSGQRAAAGGGAQAKTVDLATGGTVSGVIKLEGDAPEMPVIVMSATPQCADLHDGEVRDERVVVGAGGGLQNCFVYVEGPTGYSPPTTPAVIDQIGCQYVPHVVGVQVGQPLDIKSSDPFLHNVHYIPRKNAEQNIGFPVPATKQRTFEIAETMIRFKCEVHPWMGAWVGVLDHPFFAVTGPDGKFEIKGVPAGDYTLKVWHEEFGEKSISVHVESGATATVEESYTADG